MTRSCPAALADFEWTLTPTGWTFREYRGGSWTTLVNQPSTVLADATHLQLRIGGWEYSITALQHADYDNILVTVVVPEPVAGAMGVVLAMLAGLARPSRRLIR